VTWQRAAVTPADADGAAYRRCSMWLDQIDEPLTPRPSLPGRIDADVAIVGAGYTGLWTAYYLRRADPHLRIVVVEKEIAGYGASGRNAGWVSPWFPASPQKIARTHGREAAMAMQRAVFDAVDEVGRVAATEGIEARYHRDGVLTVASAPEQLARVREEPERCRRWGVREDEIMWLDPSAVREHIAVAGCLGASYFTRCACLDPARLVRGLARVVERLGVTIHERTPVLAVESGSLVTTAGNVRADVVVRATEGFTPELPGMRRELLPVYSLAIATEPLPPSFWADVGWSRHETVWDGRYLYVCLMRTDDDRIVVGGRGAPYRFGSKVRPGYEQVPRVHTAQEAALRELFPAAADAKVTHRWGGALGVPRDWFPSVGYDKTHGLAWAGGYVGDGVAASNLAGRTLADLITGRASPLTSLPWVGHLSRRWEPEPLRWVGVRGSLAVFASADRKERRSGRPARRAALMRKVLPL
jgi:glycine/D-amino acid oxidase-like deaminating enzyme